jgi:type I restriction enzyme S subunit
MGQSPTSDSYNIEGNGTVFHQGVTNFGSRFPEDTQYSVKGNKIAEAGAILFSVRAPVGRINIANHKTILGRGVSGITSKSTANSFLFYLLKKEFEVENKIGSGSIFQSVTKTDMENYLVLEPSQDLVTKFEDQASSIDMTIKNLSVNTKNLKRTRDLLIPQLVTGKRNILI